MRMLVEMREEARVRHEELVRRLDKMDGDLKSVKNSIRLLTDNSEASRHKVTFRIF